MLLPEIYRVKANIHETSDIFTLVLSKRDGDTVPHFLPGQFNMLYLFGIGEIAISVSGHPNSTDVLAHTIRAVGYVTRGMQKLQEGDEITLRGPFGSSWPLSKKGCDVLVIAGGVGLAPLRPALLYLADQRDHYKKITLLYGARTPQDILYKNELQEWERRGIEVKVSVDVADLSWKGKVGVVTALIEKNLGNPENTLALLCGPEIMLKFAIHELLRTKIEQQNIYLAMERNMQCAVGFCGHCQYGPYFLCKDGPVFSLNQVRSWLTIKEL